MFRKICTVALLAVTSAHVQVDIDDEKIGEAVTEIAEWAEFTAHTDEAREIISGLNHFVNKAQWKIASRQKDFLEPFVRDLQLYLKYLNPDEETCNVEGFMECSLANDHESYWGAITSQCAENHGCLILWDDLSDKEQMDVAGEFFENVEDVEHAFAKLKDEINADFMNFAVENRDNAGILAEQVRLETAHVLKRWGCNKECINMCTADMDVFSSGICNTCKCPNPISIKHTLNASMPPAQSAAITRHMNPLNLKKQVCDIGELCDENGVFVGAASDPCAPGGEFHHIDQLCDKNDHFIGKLINNRHTILVCDIPELCDENGHFVGQRGNPCDVDGEFYGIDELCDKDGVFVGSSIINMASNPCAEDGEFYGIDELCDKNGNMIASSISFAKAASHTLMFDFGKEISQPIPGQIETGHSVYHSTTSATNMFYGIGLKQTRPQSFIFLSEHASVFKGKKSGDMFAQTFGMIGQTLYVGALFTALLAMALVGYKGAKEASAEAAVEASEDYRVEAA